jgi:hypothetical protein
MSESTTRWTRLRPGHEADGRELEKQAEVERLERMCAVRVCAAPDCGVVFTPAASRSSSRARAPVGRPPAAPRAATGVPAGPVHLNTVTLEQLDSPSGVGPVTTELRLSPTALERQ